MTMLNTNKTWGLIARILHWTIAFFILLQIILGVLADEWRLSPLKLDLFVWHKSIGLFVGLLVIFRLIWRFANQTPKLPTDMTGWQIVASRVSHFVLYLCILGLPLSGWIIQSASNVPFKVFWLFPIPSIVDADKSLAESAGNFHGLIVLALFVVLVIHIGAAFYHHCGRGDNVLRRMWSGSNR